MRIDLHCHSTHSDGSLPAREVAERALARGVTLFCLTDHDTCAGYAATREVIPGAMRGVELSCTDGDRTVHLLVYEAHGGSRWAHMLEALELQQRVRRERVHTIAERLAELGAVFDPDVLLARSSSDSIGRPHIASELLRLGLVSSRAEAFDRYLKDDGPGDVRVARLRLDDGLALGARAGGRMSLAHPHLYGKQAEDLVRRAQPLGLGGLEVYYGSYKSKARRQWADLAEQYGLVATGGSDFHGAQMPNIARPGIDLPDEAGERLADWLGLPAAQLSS